MLAAREQYQPYRLFVAVVVIASVFFFHFSPIVITVFPMLIFSNGISCVFTRAHAVSAFCLLCCVLVSCMCYTSFTRTKREWDRESWTLMSLLLHVALVYYYYTFFSPILYSLSVYILGDILCLCMLPTTRLLFLPATSYWLAYYYCSSLIPVQKLLACFCEWARLCLMALLVQP